MLVTRALPDFPDDVIFFKTTLVSVPWIVTGADDNASPCSTRRCWEVHTVNGVPGVLEWRIFNSTEEQHCCNNGYQYIPRDAALIELNRLFSTDLMLPEGF